MKFSIQMSAVMSAVVLTACGGGGSGGDDSLSFAETANVLQDDLAKVVVLDETPLANLPVDETVTYSGYASFAEPGSADVFAFDEAYMNGAMRVDLNFTDDTSVGVVDDLRLSDNQEMAGSLTLAGSISGADTTMDVGGNLEDPDGDVFGYDGTFEGSLAGTNADYLVGTFDLTRTAPAGDFLIIQAQDGLGIAQRE